MGVITYAQIAEADGDYEGIRTERLILLLLQSLPKCHCGAPATIRYRITDPVEGRAGNAHGRTCEKHRIDTNHTPRTWLVHPEDKGPLRGRYEGKDERVAEFFGVKSRRRILRALALAEELGLYEPIDNWEY